MKIKKYLNEKNGASLTRKALSYTAMSGAFLALAQQSDAQTVYTDVNPDDTVMSPGAGPNPNIGLYDSFPIDFDADGVVDVVILHHIEYTGDTTKQAFAGTFSQTTGLGAPNLLANRANRIPGTVATSSANVFVYPSVLNQGDIISAGNTNLHSFLQAQPGQYKMTLNWVNSTSQYGQWNGVDGFLGVEFHNGPIVHYGWVELDIDSASSRVIVKGYAYQSIPGVGIYAGDTVGTLAVHEIKDNTYFMLTNNPASPSRVTSALFSSDKRQEYKLEIINNLGETLRMESAQAVSGNNTVKLPIENLASGNYFIRLTLGNKVYHRKLMIAQ